MVFSAVQVPSVFSLKVYTYDSVLQLAIRDRSHIHKSVLNAKTPSTDCKMKLYPSAKSHSCFPSSGKVVTLELTREDTEIVELDSMSYLDSGH